MTREEAIHKLEYSKKAYQTLIDEKVDSGKLVGDGVRGEWKAETSLDEAYKSMIEALDMALELLEKAPCEDCVSREAVKEQFEEVVHNNGSATEFLVRLWKLSPVQPKRPTGHWIVSYPDGAKSVKCNICNNYNQGDVETYFCPNCGARMTESEE